MVMRLPIGTPVEATVLRDGVEKTLRVTPSERENVDARIRELPLAGITASNLTGWSAKELRRTSRDGVRVRGVRPGGPADEAKPGLREDDVILSVDEKPVASFEALESLVDSLTRGKDTRVPALVAFDRSGERLLTVIELGRPGLEDPGLEARKAWVPISVQVLTRELADRLNLPGRTGVRVTRVFGGTAEAAGLKVGDVITTLDGNAIEASQPSDADLFATLIRQYKIGSTVTLTVVRNGQPSEVPVKVDASPRLPREMRKYEDPSFEFRVRDMAAADRVSSRLPPDQSGVLVDAVREGGWAALGHLADGDVLLTIDGEAVTDVEAVQRKMARVAEARPRSVVFKVRRGIRTFFVELETGWR
jgi:S1-C subfamily serine protease